MSIKKLKTDVRQRQIRNATAEIISEETLSKLTIDAISRRIGVTKSNIYRHYSGKDAIINDLLVEINSTLKEILAQSQEVDASKEKLKYIFFKHVELLEKFKGAPFIVFLDKNYMKSSKAKEIMEETVSFYLKFIRNTITQGIENNEFKKTSDYKTLPIVFLGNVQAVIFQWALSDYTLSIDARALAFWNSFISGILK
jgi:AcrR family transcriptional regulator